MVRWRLFYSDGSTFTSVDGPWAQAPADDVQVLVTYQDEGRKVLHDGVDEYSLPGETGVKLGRWMDTSGFYATQKRAFHSTPEEA